jgi:hypothetical protein
MLLLCAIFGSNDVMGGPPQGPGLFAMTKGSVAASAPPPPNITNTATSFDPYTFPNTVSDNDSAVIVPCCGFTRFANGACCVARFCADAPC